MAGAGIGLLPAALFLVGADLWESVSLAFLTVVTLLVGLGVGSCTALRWQGCTHASRTGIMIPIVLGPGYVLASVLLNMFDVAGTSDSPVEGVVVVVVLVLIVASSPLISRWLVLELGS